ncbi:MAG: DUF4920 domain-containing protein [Candidatus Pacearchaeota archaeon]
MKKTLILFLIVIFYFASATEGIAKDKKLGKKITLKKPIKISTIMAEPEKYVGKKVLVEGEILEVCQNQGCWMNIKSDVPDQFIKIKVKDGEIVFPKDAAGKRALAQGEVYKIELDEESAREYMQHLAEESGKAFDSTSVKGPMTLYQIKGSGAVIKNYK